MSVTFDGTNLVTTTYMTRFVKHESAATRVLNTLALAREDGQVLIDDRRGTKVIRVQGVLRGTSQTDLESKIDTFVELFSRPEKNLDIDWNGSTRRYVATCTAHDFDRDFFHLSMVPWTAEFTVLSGEGKATSTTSALSAHSVTTTTPGADSFSITGSKPAKPYIVLQGSNWPSNCAGVEYKNTDTGEKIVLTNALVGTDYFIIDCQNKKAYYSPDNVTLTEIPFSGVFPRFKIGTNNVQITAGDIVNQASTESAANTGAAGTLTATTMRIAQSFQVPYTDATFRSVTMALGKSGTPSGTLTWEIQADSNGSPAGSVITANAQGTVSSGSLSVTPAYITSTAAGAFSLTANTKYWLVLKSAATVDASNYYQWYNGSSIYPRGTMKTSTDSGSTFSTTSGKQCAFRINFGGSSGSSTVKHSVTYTPTYL